MTLAVRVIPCLDVADGRVVKGVNFENLVDAGDPVQLASFYYDTGADEVTFLDVNATSENRNTTYDLVSKTAETVFIPLTVGGGVRSTQDVDRLLKAGADKVSISSAAVSTPELINEIADRFGSQVVVLSLDAKRSKSTKSGFEVTTHGGRRDTGLDAVEWVRSCIDQGIGELLINSIDADGTKGGFDIEMLEAFSFASVPIIASGGAGSVEDFVAAARTGVSALLAASVFHSRAIQISDVKSALRGAGFETR
jgi:cyclase